MSDELNEVVRSALTDGPFNTRILAEESGLSYDLLRSWRTGRRRPSPESARRLAAALDARGRRLQRIAQDLARRSRRRG